MAKTHAYEHAFTIVELLVVVVVIGILAAITIVSYTGINNKAIISSIQLDLSDSSKQFKLFNIENGSYPIGNKSTAFDVNNCPIKPTGGTDTGYCLKLSGNNTIESYTGTATSFTLSINSGSIILEVTDGSPSVTIVPAPLTSASVTGIPEEDSVLTTAITPSLATPTATYQWQRADNASFATNLGDIPSATNPTYTLVTADVNKYIRVKVIGTLRFPGTVYSNGLGPIAASPWLTIGTQTWAKTNLNVGTQLTGANTETDNAILEKYCYYDMASSCTTYGALYQWDEAMQYVTTVGARGICPINGHIPTDTELTTLENYLGLATAGAQLKPSGTSGLNMPLAGNRFVGGGFAGQTSGATLWSSSESGTSAWRHTLNSGVDTVLRSTGAKGNGNSIRCIKN